MIDRYREQERAKALEEQKLYEQGVRTEQQQYVRDVVAAEDKRLAAQRQNINTQISSVPQAYRGQHELNEMGAVVNKWLGRERASNLGLANSGYARLQQASAQAQRLRRGTELNRQQQGDIDSLNRQLQEYIADSNLRKQQRESEINIQTAVDILNNRTALLGAADQTATQLYNTDQQAKAAAERLAADKEHQRAVLEQQQREAQQRAAQSDKAQRDSLYKVITENTGMNAVDAYRLVYGAGSINDILTYLLQVQAATSPSASVSTSTSSPSASVSTSTSSKPAGSQYGTSSSRSY